MKVLQEKSIRVIACGCALLMAFGAASCSIFGGNKKEDIASNPTTVVDVPKDRRPVVPVRQSATYTPEELKQGVVKGDWAVELVNGKTAVGQTAPFIKFEPAQGRIYGNNGCNTINGGYKYSATDGSISFSQLISTMMACGMAGITDSEINAALGAARFYKLEEKNHQYWMYLSDSEGTIVLALMRQNFDFLNGTWLVQSIKDKIVNVKGRMLVPDMKLVFDVPEAKVHGNTGCNIVNGDLNVDMDRPNSISFENMATTQMACLSEQNYEIDMLVALEEAVTAHAVDINTVELLNSQKQVIMVLVRTTDTDGK